jgi:hypothetical protein
VCDLDTEKAQKIRATIAEVVGFDANDIQDEDRFILDYSIAYNERKALLERLNAEFGKNLDFGAFCQLETVGAVLIAYLQ